MSKNRPFLQQLIIVGGFLVFLYIFFALATSIYRDYKLERGIQQFEDEIENLAELARQKPEDVKYFLSKEYRDKYAKENLNRINVGERLIIIPQEERIVKTEVVIDRLGSSKIFELPIRNQWWQYFFGHTLSVDKKQRQDPSTGLGTGDVTTEPKVESDSPSTEDNNSDEESLLEIEG